MADNVDLIPLLSAVVVGSVLVVVVDVVVIEFFFTFLPGIGPPQTIPFYIFKNRIENILVNIGITQGTFLSIY